MGLAGAEDLETNEKMIEYLKKNHSDISQHFFLTSDSVISIAACFDKGLSKFLLLNTIMIKFLNILYQL